MRELTDGPYEGTMWRWTYHDGSTWVLLCFDSQVTPRANDLVAWAVLTNQEEPHTVLGLYVDELYRGDGLAKKLCHTICTLGRDKVKHGIVYAVSKRFSKYPEILAQHGLTFQEWV